MPFMLRPLTGMSMMWKSGIPKPSSLFNAAGELVSVELCIRSTPRYNLTLHSNSLVVVNSRLRQRALLQHRRAVDIQRNLLIQHNSRREVAESIHIDQIDILDHIDRGAIVGLHLRHLNIEGLGGAEQRHRGQEGVDLGVEYAVRAKDLVLGEVEGGRGWVGDYHACDVEGGVVDIVLGDAGVTHVDAVITSEKEKMRLMDAGDPGGWQTSWVDWTYTGNMIMRNTEIKMIKCTHHHFLKCAFRRAKKPRLGSGEAVDDSNSVTPGLPDIVKLIGLETKHVETKRWSVPIKLTHESTQ